MIKEILTPGDKKISPLYYYGPLGAFAGWILFSFLTIFMVGTKHLFSGYVIFSILTRIVFSAINIYYIRRVFLGKNLNTTFYDSMRRWAGYGIMLTYVCYILPQVVADFYLPQGEFTSPLLVIFVILTTLFPAVLYIFLSFDKTRLALKGYNKKEIKLRNQMKKDKKLRNEYRKTAKQNRNALQNLWHEWVEPLTGAIMWVLVIWHFVFQLYAIPTESMVPTFLISDKVIVSKCFSGPRIPLTRWSLPTLSKPQTGDVVTFIHPDSDNEDSHLHYNSVFSRLFQPVILMLTFTKVDIDMYEKSEGVMDHKARNLVKRVIGEPGDKICMVNDLVYKKTAETDWTPIYDIPGQEQYGQFNLFYDDYPKMDHQRMNEPLRNVFTAAQELIATNPADELESELETAKNQLKELLKTTNAPSFITQAQVYLNQNESRYLQAINQNWIAYVTMESINTRGMNPAAKDQKNREMEQTLDSYRFFIFYKTLYQLTVNLTNEIQAPGSFLESITTSVHTEKDDPYHQFAAAANGRYKVEKIKLINQLLKGFAVSAALENEYWLAGITDSAITPVWALSLYLEGIADRTRITTLSNPLTISYFSLFSVANLPPFPSEDNEYIPDGEYFLIGDNRYNSWDGRFQGSRSYQYLDINDQTDFGTKITTSWDPYTIPENYLQGRTRVLIFPFNRIRGF